MVGLPSISSTSYETSLPIARAFNSEQQMELINECSIRFAEDKDFRLLIVDSIMACFRTDYSGRGELSERQQKLAQMLSKLSKLSEEYNIAILMTNQVQSDPGATMTFVAGGALKPIGGHILSHASATRMFLRKGLSRHAAYSILLHHLEEMDCSWTF